jgi:hypothetical protein
MVMTTSSSIGVIVKEVCELCSKPIQIGQPTVVCNKCDKIFHGKCAKFSNFTVSNKNVFCNTCMAQHDLIRYNPFIDLINGEEDSEKFFENDSPDFTDSLQNISDILSGCRSYSKADFSQFIGQLKNTTQISNGANAIFSTFFLNIDGNFSNFDLLVAEMCGIDHTFSAIGLAETNIDAADKDLYSISDEYTSVYQSKLGNKKKGSGIALYINNAFTYEVLEEFSICNSTFQHGMLVCIHHQHSRALYCGCGL